MRFNRSLPLALCLLAVSAFLCSCGGGAGSPGSSGSENTGLILDASVTPLYLGANTSSVDAFQQICQAGPPPVVETFTTHQATLTINARLINPNPNPPFRPTITVEKYTIVYTRSQDSIGAPPIESMTRFQTINIPAPTGTDTSTVTATIDFLDLVRKDKYALDWSSGQYAARDPNNYTATITLEGQNQFGDSFSELVQVPFEIGHFNNCQ